MGKALTRELPPGHASRWSSPTSARRRTRAAPSSAPTSAPTRLPAAGVLRPGGAQALAGASSRRDARAILTREFPGVEALQYPGGLVASVFANGYTAPSWSRCAATTSTSSTRRPRPSPRWRAPSPASATCSSSLQIDYPEVHVDTDREKAGLVGVTSRERGADHARGDARQHQHARASGSTPTTASRTTWSPPTTATQVDRHAGARRAARARQRRPGRPVLLGAYGNIRRALGPIAVERNHLERAAHVLMQTEGRDIGSGRRRPRARRCTPTRAPATSTVDFVGQVELMRTTFSGLGPGARPGGDGGVHDHGVAVQVAAPALRHAVHHPGVAGRHRPRADGGRAGLLDHRADGHPDGHRHRRVERHPAGRRRQPPLATRAPRRSTPSSPRRARASCPSR